MGCHDPPIMTPPSLTPKKMPRAKSPGPRMRTFDEGKEVR
jgi:hypothetical protein